MLNLPREQRYKIENTILVGPTEPKRISPFLDPLIDELLNLWDGVSIATGALRSFTLHAALLCFISDTRKICGFPVFNTHINRRE